LAFDGTGDYLLMSASPNFVFGTGNFTIECWVYIDPATQTSGSQDASLVELRTSGANATGFIFNLNPGVSGFKLNFYTDGGANFADTTLAYNTWHHIAVTRSGSTVRLFANGVVDKTITKSNNFTDSPALAIGTSLLYGSSSITGNIDDLRITKGFARYTGNFTPPTSTFSKS
jgi:hypothetical protein